MKLKKLYYIPGLISLIFLPVLLFIWGPPDRKNIRVLRMNLPSLNTNDSLGEFSFTGAFVRRELRRKKKIAIKLQGLHWDVSSISYKSDYSNMDTSMRSFFLNHDTLSVMDISLDAQNSYADFVWLYNEMMIHDLRRFAFLDNHFYVFAIPAPVHHGDDEILAFPAEEIYYKVPTRWELFKREWLMKYYWMSYRVEYYFEDQKQNRQLAIGFILLIALPTIIKIIRNRRKRLFFYKQYSNA
ncbi:MAG: hypothetical protein QM726_16535 [Chitinophagaceae bacterium]